MSSAALKAAATGAATPQEARNPYEGLKRQLEQSKHEFLPLLGNNPNNVDKFIRVVLNAVLQTPDLLDANRRTLANACMRAAQDGLMPDGREAVLNIYSIKIKATAESPERWEKAAQYLPMVGGLIKKMYESGEVTYVDAACVYQGEVFKYTRGDEPRIIHEPQGDGEFKDIIAVYCIVKLKNGEVKREVMFRKDIERVRAASKAKDNGPWVTWFDQQAIKSVIKRIYKQLPRTDTFEQIIASDNIASGYSELGAAVSADVRPAAPPPAPAAPPAIEHDSAPPMDFGGQIGDQQQGDPVHQAEEGTPPPAAEPAPPPPPVTNVQQTPARAKAVKALAQPPVFDYVAALAKIETHNDAEVLSLYMSELDTALPEGADKEALREAYRTRMAQLDK